MEYFIKLNMFIIYTLILFLNFSFSADSYDLDDFDDLNLNSIEEQSDNSKNKKQHKKMVLFEDNLYLLDDDFDFGNDEFELQKLELDPNDLETAREYEDFLNAFFNNSLPIGNKAYTNTNNSKIKTKQKQSKK